MGNNCMNPLTKKLSEAPEQPSSGSASRIDSNLTLEKTGISVVDAYFGKSTILLKSLSSAHQVLKKDEKILKRLTKTTVLKSPSFEDSVLAMLYIFSAGVNGNLEHIELELSEDTPFISVNIGRLHIIHREICEKWNEFIEDLDNISSRMMHMDGELNEQIQNAQGVSELAVEASRNLRPIDQTKTTNTVNANLNKMQTASRIIQHTLKSQETYVNKLSQFVSEILRSKETLNGIRNVGRLAYQSKTFDPKNIIMGFWPEENRVIYT